MKIAYTLSGGAAYGYAHIGVLKFLEELHLKPAAIAGTSMGAIVGGLYSYGYDAGQIEQIAEKIRSLELVRLFFPSFPRGGIIDTDGIRDFFFGFIQDARIEELPVQFRSVAVDIKSGEEIVFDSGKLIDAILSSMSIPAVFKPYPYHGRFLVDGGVVNNLPWDIAGELGEVNIVLDVAPQAEKPNPDRIFTSGILGKDLAEDSSALPGKTRRRAQENRLKNEEFHTQLKKLIQAIQHGDDTVSIKDLVHKFTRSVENKKEAQSIPEIITRVMAITNEYTQRPPSNQKGKTIYLHTDLMDYSLNDFHKADAIIEEGYKAAAETAAFREAVEKLAARIHRKSNIDI